MEFFDYYVKKMENIKNKFVVYVVDSDSDSESEIEDDKDLFDSALSYNQYLIIQQYMKNYDYRIPKLSEFNIEEFFILGNTALFSSLFLYNCQTILINLFKIMYVSTMICGGLFSSFVIVAYSLRPPELTEDDINDEKEYVNSISYKYGLFLNKYYDIFSNIYNDQVMMENEYTNNNKGFLDCLKDKDNHYEFDIPIEKNDKLIMYYHSGDEAFHYFTQNSDVLYVVLNSCCRHYVYKHKCLNLFQDEEEIEYIKSLNQPKQHEQEIIDSYEVVEEEENDTEENDKPKEKSIFYNKNEKNKNIKKKNEITNKINKFIRKGNLSDYELKFKDKVEKKKVNYNDFKALFDKTIEK